MHHSSVANLPKLFSDTAARGQIPTIDRDMLNRCRMDGGEDKFEGYLPKKRPRVLPEEEEAQQMGPDNLYSRDQPAAAKSTRTAALSGSESQDCEKAVSVSKEEKAESRISKITLSGSVCSSFPLYRRINVVLPGNAPDGGR